jgi:hypothetical protein
VSFLLALAPFVVFAILLRAGFLQAGLLAACAAALLASGRDLARGQPPKILEIGALILFGGIYAVTLFGGIAWTIASVRLVVDLGLLAIALVSLTIGRPFTLQIAREQTAPEVWESPAFLHANQVITVVWAAAFAVLAAADAAALFAPQIPLALDVAVTVAALAGAIVFSRRYPARAQAAARAAVRSDPR